MREFRCPNRTVGGAGGASTARRPALRTPASWHILARRTEDASHNNVAPNGANVTAFPVVRALSEALAPPAMVTDGFSGPGNGHTASIGLVEAIDCWLQEVGRYE